MDDRFVGKRLDGRYEIRELIGSGGMAVVYKAYDSLDDRIVAIKILKEEFLANKEFRRRFQNESKAIAVLNHPNIVKVYDVSFGDILQYIVMEYINGITLKEYIAQQSVIRWNDAVYFTRQVLQALQHAHSKGIVHRDIKPQNIMLLADGTIKVTDFGIARFSRSEQKTITDKAIGSVHYISPEQARGDFTDEKADIYSVGVLLYEMLTGRLPFEADSAVSVAIMQLQNNPVMPRELNPSIPKGLEEIIIKAMQKDPANRYASASEMLADLVKLEENPEIVFGYDMFIDDEPTKYIPDVGKTSGDDEEEDAEGKSPVIPVLAGIAGAFVLVIAIVGLFVGLYFGGIFPFNNKGELQVPNLIGEDYDEVKADPQYSAFEIYRENWEYSSEYEKGQITYQNPDDTKTVKKNNATIRVRVSLGKQTIRLEQLADQNETTAIQILEGLGLKYKIVQQAHNKVAQGIVIETDPPAGTDVETGQEITLYVSSGPEILYGIVPDVTTLSKDDAKKRLEQEGFKLGTVTETDDLSPKDTVLSQDPKEGELYAKGNTVNLTVSSGVSPTTAPKEYSVYIEVKLPVELNKEVTSEAWLSGQRIDQRVVNPSIAVSYSLTVKSTKRTDKLIIRLNKQDYMEFDIDFVSGQTTAYPLDDWKTLIEMTTAESTVLPTSTDQPTLPVANWVPRKIYD